MRIHTIFLQAFAAYGEACFLDFSVAKESGVFLIHGATGAGKTTLLDAICYALFGVVTGCERSSHEIRSAHAASDVLTKVEMNFSLGEKQYKITRQPEQSRPKKRGAGVTTERVQATLWDSEDGVLATGWSEVTRTIEEILGFSSEHFRQVVVLPQGEFRRLLMADSCEREHILEVLFGTGLYRRFEEYVRKEVRSLAQQLKERLQKKEWALSQFSVPSTEALDEVYRETEVRKNTSEECYKKMQEKESSSRHILEQARTDTKNRERYASAKERLEILQKEEKNILELEQRVEAANKMVPVLELEATLEEKLKQVDTLARTAKKREKAYALSEQKLAIAEKQRIAKLLQEQKNLHIQLRFLKENKAVVCDQLLETKKHFFASQASSLAKHLQVGESCPVCGSLEHPRPALLSDDKELSEALLHQKEEALQQLHKEIYQLNHRISVLDEEIGDESVTEEVDPHPYSIERCSQAKEKEYRSLLHVAATLSAEQAHLVVLQEEMEKKRHGVGSADKACHDAKSIHVLNKTIRQHREDLAGAKKVFTEFKAMLPKEEKRDIAKLEEQYKTVKRDYETTLEELILLREKNIRIGHTLRELEKLDKELTRLEKTICHDR